MPLSDGDGDELGWHFDRGEFAVTVLLQCPGETAGDDAVGRTVGRSDDRTVGRSEDVDGQTVGGWDAEGKERPPPEEAASVGGLGGDFEYATGIRPLRRGDGAGRDGDGDGDGDGDRNAPCRAEGRGEARPSLMPFDELSPSIVGATAAVVRGSRAGVRSLGPADFSPGDIMVLRGRRVLHRVTPVRYSNDGREEAMEMMTDGGEGCRDAKKRRRRPRVLAVLSFETEPGVQLNEYTRMHFFGRSRASDPVPSRAAADAMASG